ncbi:hypothetical protein T459_17600 [Capsicum annuum]|uniref:PUM-HD domain-containing protein n=1 Tax=Capsicum annuum TaxID=4072 RepID=A0A2G2ZC34_CAPAN|nr:hypothetical protein T459_17600 [Capsicum annuum]
MANPNPPVSFKLYCKACVYMKALFSISVDQYGSRFIQQKLETATTEEKNMVFEEVFPQALTLITDVFGNYVIQKFFEHGMASQRREMASVLFGHVLTLSLQMYSCQLIQKIYRSESRNAHMCSSVIC